MAKIMTWLEQLEARSPRERLLLLAAVLAVIWFLSDRLWLTPQWQQEALLAEKIEKTQQASAGFQAQISRLEAALSRDPNAENKRRLEALQRQSQELDRQLRSERQTMIDPALMPQVLDEMLGDLPLRLVSLKKLPPEIEIDSQTEGVPKVYRHGLRIELTGSYQDTLDYLRRLEGLPWRLAWEAMDIEMKRYPDASIVLTLYTLSFDEGWLGV
jgi:MSHA biogenesis protein MshJ